VETALISKGASVFSICSYKEVLSVICTSCAISEKLLLKNKQYKNRVDLKLFIREIFMVNNYFTGAAVAAAAFFN